jgi:hypothetical protein
MHVVGGVRRRGDPAHLGDARSQRKSFEETPLADVGCEIDKPEDPEDEFDVDGLNLALDELPDNEAELLRRRFLDAACARRGSRLVGGRGTP